MADEKERRRTRINSKIEQLPPDTKREVDAMLADKSNTYQYISNWLVEQGYEISRGAVGRYSLRMNAVAERVSESLEKTKVILDHMSRNPNLDPAKAAQALLTNGLMQRLSTADNEFYELPLEDAALMLARLRRVDLAQKKIDFDMQKKIDLAFERMEEQIMDTIKHDSTLSSQLKDILTKAKEMMSDE